MLELYLKIKKYVKRRFNKIEDMLDEIIERLTIMERKEDTFMASVAQDLEALRVAMNDATNAVADRIDKLTAGISNSMTDAQVASLKTGFGEVVQKLNALAADPNNPVPTDPVVSSPV